MTLDNDGRWFRINCERPGYGSAVSLWWSKCGRQVRCWSPEGLSRSLVDQCVNLCACSKTVCFADLHWSTKYTDKHIDKPIQTGSTLHHKFDFCFKAKILTAVKTVLCVTGWSLESVLVCSYSLSGRFAFNFVSSLRHWLVVWYKPPGMPPPPPRQSSTNQFSRIYRCVLQTSVAGRVQQGQSGRDRE